MDDGSNERELCAGKIGKGLTETQENAKRKSEHLNAVVSFHIRNWKKIYISG